VLVWIVAAGPRVRRQAMVLLPLIAALLLVPGIGNRLLNVQEAFEDTPDYAKDPSIVERAAAGDIAKQIFADHPIFGTGPATFAAQLENYASRKPDRLIGVTTAAHNLYLEILSETGIVGLVGWIVLVGGMLVLCFLAIVRLAGVPLAAREGEPTRGLAAGALAAVIAWTLASLFLHLSLVRTLWIMFALIGLLHVMARERAAQAGPAERHATRMAVAGGRRGLVVLTVMAMAGAAVGGSILSNLATHRYTARAALTLLPTPEVYQAYALNLRARTPVLPAYAAMLQGAQSRAALKVDGEPKTGIITFVSVGGSAEEASDRVAAAVAGAPAALHRYGADRQYTLVDVSPTDVTSERVYPPLAVILAGLAVSVELVFCLLALRLWNRRHT
jgi:O-antigen ligase